MAKRKRGRPPKPNNGPFTLLQTNARPDLAERFFASPEYKLHESTSAALRALLDRVLQPAEESQAQNDQANTAIA